MSTLEKITKVQIRIWNLVIESTNTLSLDERVLLIKFTEKLETIKNRINNETSRFDERSTQARADEGTS